MTCMAGGLCVPGRDYDTMWTGTGKIESHQMITLEWDAQGVSFLVDGVRRGEKAAWASTPPTRVRAVVNMGSAGSSVSFVV